MARSPGPVFVGGLVRVEIHDVEPGDLGDMSWVFAGGHLEEVGQIRRRIRRHEPHPTPNRRERRPRLTRSWSCRLHPYR